MQKTTRRRFIQTGGVASVVALAGCPGEEPDDEETPTPDPTPTPDEDTPTPTPEPEPEPTYEIWAADQGTHTIYIYQPTGEAAEFELVDTIDTAEEGGEVPHMVSYSSDYEYAAIACTAGARTLIYRTDDRELVANLETGPGSHFAGFTPDDDAVIVDVIGASEIVRVDVNLAEESFEIDSSIEISDEIDGLTEDEGAPICHSYDHQGRSIHTLGPSYHNAGVVIVDHDEFVVETAFSGEELPTNCGTMPHPTENKFYLTAGLPSDPEEDVDGVGDYYVFDTDSDEVITHDDTGGVDAHGFWFTPDGTELWVLNRETNDGVVIDPETDEVIEDIPAFGPDDGEESDSRDAPDIMWASPEGDYMFVTLRGPNPVSGDPHAATGVNPGFAILDIETKEILDVVQPDPEDEDSDFHGIGVRPLEPFPEAITSPPF